MFLSSVFNTRTCSRAVVHIVFFSVRRIWTFRIKKNRFPLNRFSIQFMSETREYRISRDPHGIRAARRFKACRVSRFRFALPAQCNTLCPPVDKRALSNSAPMEPSGFAARVKKVAVGLCWDVITFSAKHNNRHCGFFDRQKAIRSQ